MRSNPNPFDGVAGKMSNGTVMFANADGKAIFAAFQFLESQRRMLMVLSPQLITLLRKHLRVARQTAIESARTGASPWISFRRPILQLIGFAFFGGFAE